MNMRKIIAVLAAVLMLCSVIPMSAISVSAANLVSNGTFESDTSGWGKSTNTVVETEDGALKATHADDWAYVYTTVSLTPNTNYVLTFRAKASVGGFKVNFNDTSWKSASATVPSLEPSITTEWKEYELYFNSAAYSKLMLFFQSNQYGSAAQTIWLDDVSVSVDSSNYGTNDGYIRNGNFETGTANPWVLGDNATIVEDPTNSGQGYVVQSDESGSAKDLFSQSFLNLQAETYYKLSFKVYCYNTRTDNAFYVTFPSKVTDWTADVGNSGMGSALGNNKAYIARINVYGKTSAWYDVSITFNTGTLTAMLVKFQNYRASGGQYYFDDIKLTSMSDNEPSFDGYIKNGDFETGDLTGWTNVNGSVAEEDGNSYLVSTAPNKYNNAVYQIVNVEANTNYAISFKVKSAADSGTARLYAGTGTGNTGAVNTTYSWSVTPTWKTITVEFNSGSNTQLYINLCQGKDGGGELYFDDILMWEAKDPSYDGYITNGDFETGTATGVKTASQTYVSSLAAKDGNFGLYMINSAGNWGGVASWTFAVETGATYRFEVDMKAVSKGVNYTLWQDNSSSGVKYFSGYFATAAWTHIEKEFVATSDTAYFNVNGGNTGVSEEVYLDNLKITLVKSAHTCEFVGSVTKVPSCTEDGVMTYACTCGEGTYTEAIPAIGHSYNATETIDPDCVNGGYTVYVCSNCGHSYTDDETAALGHTYTTETTPADCVNDGLIVYTCSCGDTYTEAIPAAHTYEDDCAEYCSICEEGYRTAPHTLTYVEGYVPADCSEEGWDEYWFCAECRACYGDAEGTWQVNPAWMYYTGEHVRPEGAIPCAVVACELCGEDTYGEACTRPEDVPACQDAECVYCGDLIWGEGHSYGYDEETWESLIPLCQPGDCIYCGEHLEKIYDCENGAWASCSYDGECSYGCGKQYPADGNHMFEDGVTACDGGLCWLCWNEIEAADHVYDNEFDKTCNICGEANPDAEELYEGTGNSAMELDNGLGGLAFRFSLAIDGVAIAENRVTLADYSNATLGGNKVLKVGAIATNGVSSVDIEAKYITDLAADSIQFAVRIINIAEENFGRDITVTPYVTVEIGGEEVTFYGEEYVNSYSAVLG